MKSFAIFALFVLAGIAFAEDAPVDLLPCSFRLTLKMNLRNKDGDVLATSLNEMMRDNGEYWVWKSNFEGDDFIKTMIPDHEWVVIWRPDTEKVYRDDILAKKCYTYTFAQQPTPYEWFQSKTYGIVWYDEAVKYADQDCILHTAIVVGSYSGIDYECEANFYVSTSSKNLLFINGTLVAKKKGIDLVFDSSNLDVEHNKMIDPNSFIVNAPCEAVAAPSVPSEDFQKKCYSQQSGVAALTISWISLLLALFISLF